MINAKWYISNLSAMELFSTYLINQLCIGVLAQDYVNYITNALELMQTCA